MILKLLNLLLLAGSELTFLLCVLSCCEKRSVNICSRIQWILCAQKDTSRSETRKQEFQNYKLKVLDKLVLLGFLGFAKLSLTSFFRKRIVPSGRKTDKALLPPPKKTNCFRFRQRKCNVTMLQNSSESSPKQRPFLLGRPQLGQKPSGPLDHIVHGSNSSWGVMGQDLLTRKLTALCVHCVCMRPNVGQCRKND